MNNNSNGTKSDKIYIGSGWNRTGKYGEFVSIAFNGSRENDEYEIVAIRKSDGAQISLSTGVNISLSKVKTKKSDKAPDFSISVTPRTE